MSNMNNTQNRERLSIPPVPPFMRMDKLVDGADLLAEPQNTPLCGQAPGTALSYQVDGDHYSKLKIQPIAFIMANNIGYIEGNIIKYIVRYKDKNGVNDLKKAQHYLQMLIEQYKSE